MKSFQLIHSLNAGIPEVFPYLSDMQKFGDVHPLIFNVDQVSESEFTFSEKLSFLFFSTSFKYNVSVNEINLNKSVKLFSEVQKGVTLKLQFDFKTEENQTKIIETFEIYGPFFVMPIFVPLLKSAHVKLFKAIREQLTTYAKASVVEKS